MIYFICIYVYVSEVAFRGQRVCVCVRFPGAGITGCLMWFVGTKFQSSAREPKMYVLNTFTHVPSSVVVYRH